MFSHLRKNTWMVFVVAIVALVTASAYLGTRSTQFFPTKRLTPTLLGGAVGETTGELVFSDGCLRIVAEEIQADHLIIWPANFYVRGNDDQITIWQFPRKKFAKVGDEIYLGGGEVKNFESISQVDSISESTKEQLELSGCSEPFWIANI